MCAFTTAVHATVGNQNYLLNYPDSAECKFFSYSITLTRLYYIMLIYLCFHCVMLMVIFLQALSVEITQMVIICIISYIKPEVIFRTDSCYVHMVKGHVPGYVL